MKTLIFTNDNDSLSVSDRFDIDNELEFSIRGEMKPWFEDEFETFFWLKPDQVERLIGVLCGALVRAGAEVKPAERIKPFAYMVLGEEANVGVWPKE